MLEKAERGSNAGWREIGGKRMYFRSKWEAQYARFLQWSKEQGHILDWEHEPKTFWFENIKRGVRSYLPDFRVWHLNANTAPPSEDHHWVEVKGWLDPKSATKLKRMAKYYPDEKIFVIDKTWFAKNNHMMRNLIKDWE
jgi:hypothetical protein